MVGVNALLRHRVVLVEIERDDVREAQALFAMHANELSIHTDRRRPGREAEHGRLARRVALVDERRNARCDESRDVTVIVDDDGSYALVFVYDGVNARRPAIT